MEAVTQSWTDNCFNEFRAEMARRFDELDRRMDERFEQVDRSFEQVDERFEQVDRRFEQVDRRFKQVDKRFEQVDKRFEQVDTDMRFQRGELGSMQRTMALGATGMSAAYLTGFGALIAFLAVQL